MKKLSFLTRTSFLLAAFFFAADILGALRSIIIARQFDLSFELDAFNVANNLPDILDEALFNIDCYRRMQTAEGGIRGGIESLEHPSDQVSFGLVSADTTKLEAVESQFKLAMERVWRMVSHFAYVETAVDGALTGRTMLGWSGNLNTLWEKNVDPDRMDLHQRNLQVAVASRHSLLRVVTVTVQSAVKISALITTPAGAVMALPVAWKFINQLLTEVKTLQG